MKLTIKTQFSEEDIDLGLGADKIYLHVTEDGSTRGAWLSAFEAQTLAEALLKMANSLAPKQEITGKDDSETGAIEWATSERNEMTLREPIESITITDANAARIKMKSGKVIFTTKETWAHEGKALQAECDRGADSYMNIRREDTDSVWFLIDTLPF